MKVTCGTDIIEISRIKKLVDENKGDFVNRVYSEAEIEYCEGKHHVKYQDLLQKKQFLKQYQIIWTINLVYHGRTQKF